MTDTRGGRAVALVGVLGVLGGVGIAAQQTDRIFEPSYDVQPTVAGTLLVVLVVAALRRRHVAVRLVLGAVGVLATASVAAIVADGSLPSALVDAVTHGFGDIVGARWPSPATPASVTLVAALSALCGAAAAELVVRRRAVAALAPSLALLGVVALLSAEAGPPDAWLVALVGVTSLATLQSARTTPHSWFSAVLSLLVVAVVAVVPLGLVPAVSADRYDPRDHLDVPPLPVDEVSPLSRVDEWHSFEEGTVMFATTLPTPARWRLVGLTRYDGTAWQPAADYRPASEQLATPAAGAPVVPVEVTIGSLDSAWLPQLETTVAVSEPLRVDGTGSGLLPDARPTLGSVHTVSVQPTELLAAQVTGARLAAGDPGTLASVEVPPAVQQLASRIVAGATTDYDRAQAIATYLREQYAYDPETPPGHSLAVLDLFIETTRRGTDEQFVAGYGLLAAAAGLPVRIAVGFDTVSDGNGGTAALAAKAVAWPEVHFDGVGWVEFDPVPDAVDQTTPDKGEGAVAPIDDAVVEPPPTTVAPTTQSTLPATGTLDDDAVDGSNGVSTTTVAALTVVLGALALSLLYAAIVLLWKRRRRQRRRHAPDPDRQLLGAFRSGIDTVVDLGATVRASSTDAQLLETARSVVGEPARVLAPVASGATAAVFAPEPPSEADAAAAWELVEQFEATAAVGVGRWRHLRAKLSLRSLRRGLRD